MFRREERFTQDNEIADRSPERRELPARDRRAVSLAEAKKGVARAFQQDRLDQLKFLSRPVLGLRNGRKCRVPAPKEAFQTRQSNTEVREHLVARSRRPALPGALGLSVNLSASGIFGHDRSQFGISSTVWTGFSK